MKVSVRFSLVSGKQSDLPIRIRVSYDGLRLDLRTGFVCPPSAWNDKTMRMLPGTTNRYREKAAMINAKLSDQESCLMRILTRYELEGKVPDADTLKTEFERAQGRVSKKSDPSKQFGALLERYVAEQSKIKGWSSSTVASHIALKKRVNALPLAQKPIEKVSQDDMRAFVDNMLSERMLNTSIVRIVRYINSFLNWCKKKDLYSGHPLEASLKGTGTDNTIYYLEWDEVLRIYDLEGLTGNAATARDMFCLQCFSGLRTSDASSLQWSQIFLDADVPYMLVTTIKTSDNIRIELNDFAIAILRKYVGRGSDAVFPILSLPARNRNLTHIAHLAGIHGTITKVSFSGSTRIETTIDRADAITTHWGRHSFIVHALSIGIAPNIVMSWTGHSNYDAMRPYINIVDKVKIDSMRKFNLR